MSKPKLWLLVIILLFAAGVICSSKLRLHVDEALKIAAEIVNNLSHNGVPFNDNNLLTA